MDLLNVVKIEIYYIINYYFSREWNDDVCWEFEVNIRHID